MATSYRLFDYTLLDKAKQEEEGNPAVTPKTLLNAASSAKPAMFP